MTTSRPEGLPQGMDIGAGGSTLPGLPSIRTLSSPLQTFPAAAGAATGAPLPPLAPTAFQRFVQESTGQALPLFGATLFESSAGGFAPVQSAPVPADYPLGPGDEVQIRGWGAVDIDVRAVIDRGGLIHIPRVGAVKLAGVRAEQAEGVIQSAVGKYYRDFQLSVSLGQLRGITVYVVGQARKPGAYTLSSLSTLVSALFASGGPGASGSMRQVQVKRGDKVVTELDLYAFLAKGDKAADIQLQDGDVIVIPAARGHVALSGKVTTPAVYEIKRGDTLESILAVAGGLPVVADPKRVFLERLQPEKTPPRSVESFALDAAGLKRPLKSGDLLTVLPLTPEFGAVVTLRGNVDQPVRLPWRAGMTVRDLIPSRERLMSQASVRRQNEVLLSEEGRERARAPFAAVQEADASQPSGGRVDAFGAGMSVTGGRGAAAGDPRAAANNGALPLARTGRTGIVEGSEGGEVRDSTDTLARRIGNLVDEVNFDYAVVERVNREDLSVQLLPFNLGRALADAGSPDNLALQSGDVVTVFSVNDVRVPQAKRQVFVRIEGEVTRPGVYQMKAGDTLQTLLVQAGGLTPDAYLFGSAFYREEVRRTQAENLERLIRRLEAEQQTQLGRIAANLSQQEAATAQLRLQTEQQAQLRSLQRLRALRPEGRIALGLQPGNPTETQLPSIKLENQDRFVVPSRPDFVYVLGSVNTESSLLYRAGKDVGDYMAQAGVTRGADTDATFVIRADGSVVSNGDGWFSKVERTEVQPGDTIVLPEKLDHETAWSVFMRNAKDVSQIIYQLSLGAAAVKSLRD